MKWFKHDTDASDDIKIRRLEEEFGNDGYAVFFKTLEILGKEGEKARLKFEKYPKKWISERCKVTEEKVTSIYEFMATISLCCSKSLKKNELYISNFKKRADDYTKRIRRVSEGSSNNVLLDKNRTEEEKKRNREHLKLFEELHLKETGVKYVPSFARDKALLYTLMNYYDKDTLNLLIKEFFISAEDGTAWHADKLEIPVFKRVVGQLIGRRRKTK